MIKRLVISLTLILLLLELLLSFVIAQGEWVVEGNKVYVDDENVYLSATPATLGSSGWVEFELLSKRYTGEIDIVFGLPANSQIILRHPQYWADYLHELYRWVDVEKENSITIDNIVSYQILELGSATPDIGNGTDTHLIEITVSSIDASPALKNPFVVAFTTYEQHSPTSATFNYHYWTKEKETYYESYEDWRNFGNVSFDVSYYEYQGNTQWRFIRFDQFIETDRLYRARVWVEMPFAGFEKIDGKYFFGVKPSNETVKEAIDNEHAYWIDPWWNSQWTYKKKLTIDNTASAENLINFPVLVHLDDTNIDWTKVQNAGEDIRFVDANDTTELDYEIEQWDDTNDAWIWVEVPQIDAGVNTDFIYMYYGNALAADGQDVEGTWNSNYVAVYHMDDDPDSSHIKDSTSYGNDGTKKAANEPIEVAGTIGKAQDFDETDDYIALGNDTSISDFTELTFEWIIKPNAFDGSIDRLIYGGYYHTGYGFIVQNHASANIINPILRNTAGTPSGNKYISVNPAIHQYVGISWDGSFAYEILNGVKNSPTAFTGTIGIQYGTYLGGFPYSSAGGIYSEYRISNIDRSADWIEATDLNFDETYITFGSESSVPADAPLNFTLTPVNDEQVDISWTNGDNVALTEIRRAIGGYPATVTDGTQVYSGADTSYSDTANNIGLNLNISTYYYRAWNQSALGVWSEDYAEGQIGGENMFLLILGILALGLTAIMFITKRSMLGFPSAIMWACFGAYLFTISEATWDIYYILGFASLLGMVTFCALGAYGLREKRDTIAEEDIERGEGNWLDEDKEKESDIFSDEAESKADRKSVLRNKARRERAKRRRTSNMSFEHRLAKRRMGQL